MTWGKVDDKLHSHPKAEDAGLEAMGLWVMALSYSVAYLTDGLITRARVSRLAGERGEYLAGLLVDAGLWEVRQDGGWQFHDWADYQPTRAAVEAEKAKKALAGRAGGLARGAKTTANGSDDDGHEAPVQADVQAPAQAGDEAAAQAPAQADAKLRARDPVPSRPVPFHEHTHTARAPDPDPPEADTAGPGAAHVAALRTHRVILEAAEGAPVGADKAIAALADTIEGFRTAKGAPVEWVERAIADAARDLAAEASGVGSLAWTAVATKVSRYASRARRPREEAQEPHGKGGQDLPLSEDERWTSQRWRDARRRRGLPDGEPDRKHVVALWAKASAASAEATAVDGWKPSPREIVAFQIKSYLSDGQDRPGGIVDQNYPLPLLVARAGQTYGLPPPPRKADPKHEVDQPEPVRAPAPTEARELAKTLGGPMASVKRPGSR